jgi:predicted PurR-regulated permease PerM
MKTQGPPATRFYTRSQVKDAALIAVSILVLYGCWALLEPFLAPVTWALALAVVARPLQNRLEQRLQPTAGALLGVVIIVIVVLGPTAFVTRQIISEARHALPQIEEAFRISTSLQSDAQPAWVRAVVGWIQARVDIDAELQKATTQITSWASSLLGGSVWAITQLLVMIVTLFYFLRDHSTLMRFLEDLAPLSDAESEGLFDRISEAIYATIYGNLFVKIIQGILTGAMFWALGLPMPILAGTASALAALLPMVGTALVWGPAVVWFFVKGLWIKGVIMALWGSILVSLIDNFLYPTLVASELKMHPLGVFFSIFGGMILFGLVGMVLGPVILAIARALLVVWRTRLEDDVEQPS